MTGNRVFRCMVLFAVAAGTAHAAPPDPLEQHRREMIGKLYHTRIDAELNETPAREAFELLARAVDIQLIVRWSDDQAARGMEADVPVSVALEDVRAIDALEIIIDQAALFSACTWQTRAGFIEVGTKRRLSALAARKREVYPLTDLAFRPPYLGRVPASDRKAFDEHPYRAAALRFGGWNPRQSRSELIRELLRCIAEIVEIGNWDTGDQLVGAVPNDPRFRSGGLAHITQRAVALIRLWRDEQVVIVAPDFMHRQIINRFDGIVPPQLSDDDILLRTARADGGTSSVRPRRIDRTDPPASSLVISSHERRTTDDDLERPIALAHENMALPGVAGRLPLVRGEVRGDGTTRRLIGTLLTRPITVSLEGAEAREAFDLFAQQLGVPIFVRYDDDMLGYGIDPYTPVSLDVTGARAITVLEALLDQCDLPDDEVTWQIRRGYIELGTKSRLSVPAARETRVYLIRDLMVNDDGTLGGGPPAEVFALNLVEEIVTTIEPDAWDWGQPLEALEDATASETGIGGSPPDGRAGSQPANAAVERYYVEPVMPALIRHWGEVIIVHAPDFIHRQLAGYPHPDG